MGQLRNHYEEFNDVLTMSITYVYSLLKYWLLACIRAMDGLIVTVFDEAVTKNSRILNLLMFRLYINFFSCKMWIIECVTSYTGCDVAETACVSIGKHFKHCLVTIRHAMNGK